MLEWNVILNLIFIFLLGLIFGSFISALSYRLPKSISIARGRSFCPNCKHQIAWFDNIPLFSYLMLCGKCRNCRKPISIRYPLIEFATAAGFLLIFLRFSPSFLNVFYYLTIFCILLLIFIIDLEHQIIPDTLVFWGISIVFVYFLIMNSYFFPNIFAGLLAATFLMIVHIATRGRGMGLGDIKFAVFGGMVTGLKLMPMWLFASFLTGGAAGIILILARRAGLKDKIAFGPFLVLGLVIALIWGEKILHLLLLN